MTDYTTRTAVAEKLREILVEGCIVEPGDQVRDDQRLVEDLKCDSLDMVELVMWAEESFPIGEIADSEIEQLDTFGQLVDLVCARLKIGAAA